MKILVTQQKTGRNPAFSKLKAAEVMRHQVICLKDTETIATAIRTMIKFKIDAILVVDQEEKPVGVVTKTEIMGAYYATMELSTPLMQVMGAPVIHCLPDDSLESALVTMQSMAIHRLYVVDIQGMPLGTLSYPDVVGALYRYCCDCSFSLKNRNANTSDSARRLYVNDIMTATITSVSAAATICEVIEQISTYAIGAVLVMDSSGAPAGVISKTDLALAFRRGVNLDEDAAKIMKKPIRMCHYKAPLEEAIKKMIFYEISRLFTYSSQSIAGVVTLSDAARARSGSCQACSTSRIIPKKSELT